jgi:tetratricopeptide (TPR) repeat protein
MCFSGTARRSPTLLFASFMAAWPSASVSLAQAQAEDDAASAQDDAADAQARALFQAGQIAYERAEYEAALQHFEEAYDLSGRALLLLNVAQAADRLRRDEIALAALERFLQEAPDSDQRLQVEARLRVLRESQQRRAREADDRDSSQSPAVADPPRSDGTSDLPWILVAAGAGLTVVGGVLLAVGLADYASVEGAADGSSYEDFRDAEQRAPVLTGVGIPVAAVGLATVALGLTWAVLSSGASTDRVGSTRSIRLSLGFGSAVLHGQFQ